MSKAAGAPSEKCERPPSSPDVRPSQLNYKSLFSSASCPDLHVTARAASPLYRRHGTPCIHESRPLEQVCHKHEAQYAMNLFGAQPEIDFTIKRGHGAFSPHQSGARRSIVNVAGSRSANSDKCEAAQTLRFWGAAPYIEVVGRRGTGSCSPRIEGRDVEASCVTKNNYLQDCLRSGVSDISEVHKLGVGECSPRRSPETGASKASSTPANFISKEVRMASSQKLVRAVTISPRVFEVEVPCLSTSRNSSSPSSPISSSRGNRRWCDDDESYDIPRWAHPTSASRARNAQDLSNVKVGLHGSSSRTTRSGTTASVDSSSVEDISLCTHSCRLGTESSSASVKSGSVGSTSRCTHSCRLGSEASSLAGSGSTSRCTHSCRVGSRGSFSQGSNFSSASTTSSFPQSHKSFRLAGDILSDLKRAKNVEETSKPPTGYDAPPISTPGWFMPPHQPKLAGNILSDLRTSPTRCKGVRHCEDWSLNADASEN